MLNYAPKSQENQAIEEIFPDTEVHIWRGTPEKWEREN